MSQMTLSDFPLLGDIHPPIPNQSSAPEGKQSSDGKEVLRGERLRSLLRGWEAGPQSLSDEQNTGHVRRLDEAASILQFLAALYARRGLLQGQRGKAVAFLTQPADDAVDGVTDDSTDRHLQGGKKKAKRSAAANGGLGSFDRSAQSGLQFDDARTQGQDLSPPVDEIAVLDAAAQVLSAPDKDQYRLGYLLGSCGPHRARLVKIAADLCATLSDRALNVSDHVSNDPCIIAEYEMLARVGKQLLAGLAFHAHHLAAAISGGVANTCDVSDDTSLLRVDFVRTCSSARGRDVTISKNSFAAPMVSCFRAATSLIALFNCKLSRCASTILKLKETAIHALSSPENTIQTAGAELLSIIPVIGGLHRKTPSESWNLCSSEVSWCISFVLDATLPISKAGQSLENSDVGDTGLKAATLSWISRIRDDLTQEQDRAVAIKVCLQGLTRYFEFLLSHTKLSLQKTRTFFVEAVLDVENWIMIGERLLSFPLSAEGMYYRTKKRLRNETNDGGLLSPRYVASYVASYVKIFGHSILEVLAQSITGPLLMPYARRLMRISYASLVSSCSGPLRMCMDPTNALQLDGKKRRWLHTSIQLRTESVLTCQRCMLILGVEKSRISDSSMTGSQLHRLLNDSERAVMLVGGCLVEQLQWDGSQDEDDEDWGTISERMELAKAAIDCLMAVLTVSCGHLSFSVRSLIDSITATCLSAVENFNCPPVLSGPLIQQKIFGLATACLLTPWADGSTSSIADVLNVAAQRCRRNGDFIVSLTSGLALQACDRIGTPRGPALLYATRESSARDFEPTDHLLKGIQNAKQERAAAMQEKKREVTQDTPSAKRAKTTLAVSEADTGALLPPVGSSAKEESRNIVPTSKKTISSDAPKAIATSSQEAVDDEPVLSMRPSTGRTPAVDEELPTESLPQISKGAASIVTTGDTSGDAHQNEEGSDVEIEIDVEGGPDSEDE